MYLEGDCMRIILHIDVNNAFLSWTAVWMLKNGSKIDIRNKYAVIAGDEDARRGIVVAKSYPCKRAGVKTTDTLYMARKKCPYLEVYKSNFKIFNMYSNLMYNYLLNYTDKIERYSIDECFLDYTDVERLFGDPIKIAYKIKNDIKKLFGFTVNVGIGNNKLEAKMASDFLKPDRVHTLFDYEVKTKMWPLPIDDLFMVGKSTTKRLKQMGINTIKELATYDKNIIVEKFKSHGKLIWEFANGIDESDVYDKKREQKSISCSSVLPYNYNDKKELYKVLKLLSNETGRRLRNKKLYANSVDIWIKYSNFKKYSKQLKLNNAIDSDKEIFNYACSLFDKLWNDGEFVRALCVGVGNVSKCHNKQLSLFDKKNYNGSNDNNNDKLQKAIDKIRDTYGDNKILYADEIKK